MSELEPTTEATPEVVENVDDVTEQAAVEEAQAEAVVEETPAEVEVVAEVKPEVEETPAEAEVEPVVESEPVVEEMSAEAEVEPVAETEPVVEETPAEPEVEPEVEETPAEVQVEPVAETEPAAEETPAEESGSPAAPHPVPRPSVAGIRPAVPTPSQVPVPSVVAAMVTPPTGPTPAENAEAARWGRVDDDGSVYVRESSGERLVGQYAGGDAADALAFYLQRYWDLNTKVVLFEARLGAADLSGKEIDSTIAALDTDLAEPAAVGDLDSLRARVEGLREIAAARRAAVEAERAAAKKAAFEARTAIVEAAEKIAATDPARIQWRPSGEKFQELLAEWKEVQRKGPRLDRPTEDSLWKRFSHARSTFDRERHRYFAELEKTSSTAKAAKEALVLEAEKLSKSTDWGATAGAYRDLMTRWKAAGRASRKDDDALWARFRAAQDAFFAARDSVNQQIDEEYGANLEVKLALLEEAERLVPVTDLAAAKVNLRDIQERWEKAGKVPRADIQRVEARMHAVEQAVRDAEQIQWRRSNPETRARAEGAAAQLHAAIESLEDELAAATKKGDKKAIAEVEAALVARRAWLEQVEKAAEDSRG